MGRGNFAIELWECAVVLDLRRKLVCTTKLSSNDAKGVGSGGGTAKAESGVTEACVQERAPRIPIRVHLSEMPDRMVNRRRPRRQNE